MLRLIGCFAADDRLTPLPEQNNFAPHKVFREHTDPISCIAWSPDDTILLTAAEMIIKMWNTEVSS